MTTISALIVAKNEQDFIQKCIESILPYVQEIIFVDNESTDATKQIVENLKNKKIKVFTYPATENQGELRQFSLNQAACDWIWQIDADEIYPKDACKAIVDAVNAPGQAISFRVGYRQLSWRHDHREIGDILKHFPDRLYRRDVIDTYSGVLPNDMTKVKPEFYNHRPYLEYDNQADGSFENSKQPILPVFYYHLARTRGYNYEFNKWKRYNKNIHPEWNDQQITENARMNGWVSGQIPIEPFKYPFPVSIPNPKVSVIIPNHNYEQYVGLAIQSVMEQSYPAFEIIVVDDGSTDGSRVEIDKYEVKKIYTPNFGVACARNEGAKQATGDYLLFLDADDELDRNYLARTVPEMKGDIQVVYTDMRFIGNQNDFCEQPEFSIEEMRRWQVVPSACALVDKRAWCLVGGFDHTEIYEDWGFFLRLAINCFNFYHVKEPLFKYRIHGKSRIDYLDSRMIEGFDQLKLRYGITREPDLNRMNEAKAIWEKE
jgi:glycosyltransferase involved in cell wall biosynthesis